MKETVTPPGCAVKESEYVGWRRESGGWEGWCVLEIIRTNVTMITPHLTSSSSFVYKLSLKKIF